MVILHGHMNKTQLGFSYSFRCLSDLILRGHLNIKDNSLFFMGEVSVIVILRGHLNTSKSKFPWRRNCLSDRNPTWPPEHNSLRPKVIRHCLSDRNPTWPLEPMKAKAGVNLRKSQWS